jgi:hypothetical protein
MRDRAERIDIVARFEPVAGRENVPRDILQERDVVHAT